MKKLGCPPKGPNKFYHRKDGTTVLILERKDGSTLDCVINSTDFELVRKYRWYADKGLYTFYAKASNEKPPIKMHRLLLPGAKLVDHRDENGLNNRRKNLRAATRSQNAVNTSRKRISGKTSRFQGVWKSSRSDGKFESSARVNGRRVYLGVFDSEEAAASAYQAAMKKEYGEFIQEAI